jgi:hypothetical protein
VPTPLYQYFIFANQKLDFSGGNLLYKVKGGRIHSNKNITFAPTSYYDFPTPQTGIRFAQLTEMSAAGTIQYKRRNQYPGPWVIDFNDYYDENNDGSYNSQEVQNGSTGYREGMLPAPYPTKYSSHDHFWTTMDTYVRPGPLAYWCPGCSRNPAPKSEWLTGDYMYQGFSTNESLVNAPWLWQGEDQMFYGKQYNGSMAYRYTDETRKWRMLADGSYGNTTGVYVYSFDTNLNTNDLDIYNNSIGEFFGANVMFKPYQDAMGVNNTNKWIEIPGSLPQTYKWEDKYSNSYGAPVKFYETELCRSNATFNASCMVDNFYCVTNNTGWRYRKKLGSSYCNNNACYNNTSSTFVAINASTQVPVNGTMTNYFDLIITDPRDRNNEFFEDFTYGNDANDTSSVHRDIRAFNILKQPAGFQKYQQKLASLGFGPEILKAGVARKYFDLGQLFDKPGSDSVYKTRAQQDGIYIDETNANSIKTWLNSAGYPALAAWPKTFYNWRTARTISVFDINVGQLRSALPTLKPSFNGIIYSKVPIRLSYATNLPGTNEGDRKAVFTVLCEESIYLKGSYNTVEWKISHLATKKIIYGLSSSFNDPSYRDFRYFNGGVYNGTYIQPWDMWKSIYLKLNTTSGIYWPCEEGTPGVDTGQFWGLTDQAYQLPAEVDQCHTYMVNRTALKQQEWESKPGGYYPPNQVTGSSTTHYYNSLFLTPYNFPSPFTQNYNPSSGPGSVMNFQFEDWRNPGSWPWPNATVSVRINGSMINLYDTPGDPAGCCDDEYWAACNTTENPFDERNTYNPRATYHYLLYYTNEAPDVFQEYDDRLPDAVPKNYQAVLGMTGESVWRQISEDYFYNNTGG